MIQLNSYPRECMKLVTDETRRVPKIESGGFRSLEYELVPQKDCVEGQLLASVSYIDHKNDLKQTQVKPFTIKSVCDLMVPLAAKEATFDREISAWQSIEETVAFKEEKVPKVVEDVVYVFADKNFQLVAHHVNEEGDTLTSVSKGYAIGKYTERRMGIVVTVTGHKVAGNGQITCTGYAEDPSMLVACMSEVLDEFRKPLVRMVRRILKDHKDLISLHKLRRTTSVEPSILVDAIRQEEDLVFLHDGDDVCDYDYLARFVNNLRAKYDVVPVKELATELKIVGKTPREVVQELIASGRVRAVWLGTEEIKFKAEMRKVAVRALRYVIGIISGLITIISVLLALP